MSVKTIKATAQDMICDARYAIKCTWAKTKQTRLARLPDFKHDGLQATFFFGAYPDPEVPLALQMGWKTCIIGFFKVKDTKKEIDKTNIKGFVFQFRIWLPLDGFGIL